MLRATYRLIVLSVLIAASSVGYYYYHNPNSPAVQVEKLKAEKHALEQFVQRLTEERRVAEMIVIGQRPTPTGVETTLLFVEQARDGTPLPAKTFTVQGDHIYVAGLSIRFNQGWIEKDDPLRGRGLFLFTKIFGDKQTPANGLPIDQPGQIPDVYRGDPKEVARVSEFEKDLWSNFWKLVDDKALREDKGVAIASGKAVHFQAALDRLYTITLDAAGSPTVEQQPVKPIYREAMRRPATNPAVQ